MAIRTNIKLDKSDRPVLKEFAGLAGIVTDRGPTKGDGNLSGLLQVLAQMIRDLHYGQRLLQLVKEYQNDIRSQS